MNTNNKATAVNIVSVLIKRFMVLSFCMVLEKDQDRIPAIWG